MIEPLGHIPRAAFVFGLLLNVAACHVDAHTSAPNVVLHLIGRNVRTAFADSNHQFDFVVKIIGKRRIGHGAGAIHHGICRFCEKERRFTGVISHFHHVFFIVAAHTKNAAHWETIR